MDHLDRAKIGVGLLRYTPGVGLGQGYAGRRLGAAGEEKKEENENEGRKKLAGFCEN
jgi:hypothetical protein